MRLRFRLAGTIVALATALLIAAPVATASTWTVFSESGTRAFAANGECTELPDGSLVCENQFVDVFRGTVKATGEPTFNGQRVCYHESVDTFAANGSFIGSHGRSGCTLDAGTLTIKKLASITLAPTLVELREMECDAFECTESPGGTVTVSGTWTGTGPIVRQSGKFQFGDGTCRQLHSDRSRSRQAEFEGSIETAGAGVGDGSMTFRTNCEF